MNKIGRNDPCPCGAKTSDGKYIKYKKCCMNKEAEQNVVSEVGVLRKAYEAKDGEDFFHVAVGHQHATGHHVDNRQLEQNERLCLSS